MKAFAKFAAMVLAVISFAASAQAQGGDETTAVRAVIMRTFDKPEAPLTVEPVAVEADIAVAGWVQGEMGGRALLKKRDGKWTLILCSGDSLKDPAALRQFGLTQEQAQTLASAVIEGEAKLNRAVVEKLSRFDGIVMMQRESDPHPSEQPQP